MSESTAATGSVLFCADPDLTIAVSAARQVPSLLAVRRAVVLATSSRPKLPLDPYAPEWKALFEPRDHLATAAYRAAVDAADAACLELRAQGWEAEPRVVREERAPWEVALREAEDFDAAAIVMGARRQERMAGCLGHETRALADRTTRPLLVVPPRGSAAPEYSPVVVAYDGSPGSGEARACCERLLARRPAVVATAWERVSVTAPYDEPESGASADAEAISAALQHHAQRTADAAARDLIAAGWPAQGHACESTFGAWGALVQVASAEGAALVVTGTRGDAPVMGGLIGSVADGILRHAERPVLLVPLSRSSALAAATAADAAARHDRTRQILLGLTGSSRTQ